MYYLKAPLLSGNSKPSKHLKNGIRSSSLRLQGWDIMQLKCQSITKGQKFYINYTYYTVKLRHLVYLSQFYLSILWLLLIIISK